MHQPSVRVLKLLSGALNVSAEMLLAEAGLIDPVPRRADAGPAAMVPAVTRGLTRWRPRSWARGGWMTSRKPRS